jgi:hypothetical protein
MRLRHLLSDDRLFRPVGNIGLTLCLSLSDRQRWFGALAARRTTSMHKEAVFSATDVQELVDRARAIARPPDEGPQGWSVSDVDPGRIVQVFEPAIRLRAEYVLRGYQYRAGGDGNGVVYALPSGTAGPKPRRSRSARFRVPPRAALKSWIDALELDGTPWAYLCLSLLGRELTEFGAICHGTSWGVHTVIGRMPWIGADGDRLADADGWTGSVLGADELAPRVVILPDEVVVRLHTYTPLGMQRVVEQVDRYRNGRVSVERRDVAIGPPGIVF